MSNEIDKLTHAERLLGRMLMLPFKPVLAWVPSTGEFNAVPKFNDMDAQREYETLRRDIRAYLDIK